jgi:LacI family transcriptional regulator
MVTLKDIARHAGVSIQTVSNVINDRPFVREETRVRVLQACAELDYHPNAAARSLVTQRRQIIGLALARMDPVYSEIVDAIVTHCEPHGYSTIISTTKRDADAEARAVNLLIEQRVDGVLLASSTHDSVAADLLRTAGIPFVRLLQRPADPTADYFGADNCQGAVDMTRYLLGLGHTAVGFVRGPVGAISPLTSTSLERERGVRQTMSAAGLPLYESRVADGGYSLQGGYRAGKLLLERTNPPTAIECASDLMALGVMDAALDLGLAVPGDLSVTGFDDIFVSSLGPLSLTTVHVDCETIAGLAIRRLLGRIDGETRDEPPEQVSLPCELRVRGTSAPPHPRHAHDRSGYRQDHRGPVN